MSKNNNKSSFWKDFKSFITKGNIIDLAVAVVIGAAFNKIVTSLVSSIITPLTGLFIKTGDLAELKWVLKDAVLDASGEISVPAVTVTYGLFLQSLLDFLVISLCIFVALRVIMKIKNTLNHKEIAAAEAKSKAASEAAAIAASEAAAAASAEASRQEQVKQDLIRSITVQAESLGDIRDILRRIETKQGGSEQK